MANNWFVTASTINGQPEWMLVDSGSTANLIEAAEAKKLHLDEDGSRRIVINGGFAQLHSRRFGIEEAQHPRKAKKFSVGDLINRENESFTVGGLNKPGDATNPFRPAGLIGAPILSDYEVELDFPGQQMAIYDKGCGQRGLPTWTGRIDIFEPSQAVARPLFTVPVFINGHLFHALIDTGSNVSSIAQAAAIQAGVDENALRADPDNSFFGAEGRTVRGNNHRFESFRLGSVTYRNAVIPVREENLAPGIDMLLGMDVLKWRKVWLSYATGRVFLQVPRPTTSSRPMAAPPPSPAQPASDITAAPPPE